MGSLLLQRGLALGVSTAPTVLQGAWLPRGACILATSCLGGRRKWVAHRVLHTSCTGREGAAAVGPRLGKCWGTLQEQAFPAAGCGQAGGTRAGGTARWLCPQEPAPPSGLFGSPVCLGLRFVLWLSNGNQEGSRDALCENSNVTCCVVNVCLV